MKTETKLIFAQLDNAIQQLEQAIQTQICSDHRLIIDGTIHRFEFTFELFWKALKKQLQNEFDTQSYGPRQVLQLAYANKLINDEKMWLKMLEDRNLMTHVYQEKLADQIYQNILLYTPFLRKEFAYCITR